MRNLVGFEDSGAVDCEYSDLAFLAPYISIILKRNARMYNTAYLLPTKRFPCA